MLNSGESPKRDSDIDRVLAPWERVFDRFSTPLEYFIHRESSSGLILFICAVLAVVAANSTMTTAYHHSIEFPITIGLGSWEVSKSLHHWVNDGLMTLFFFVVGLEIKREILVGELSNPRQAALPIVAALAGMVAPALLYLLVVPSGLPIRGWGIPMATDIAFAVSALVLLGTRMPRSLLTFLLALAIVDDLGSLVVIALFYTASLDGDLLLLAVGWITLLVFLNMLGVRRPWPYFVVGLLLWGTFLESGVHPTLSGVLTAFAIPARPRYHPVRFADRLENLLQRYRSKISPGESILRNQELRSTLQTMENSVTGVMSPLQRLEHKLHTPVAFLIVPLFAFLNAGIQVDADSLIGAIGNPVTQGVMLGLLLGKPIGITFAIWAALKIGLVQMPRDTTIQHVFGVALLAGIGFTMSIFISELAFGGSLELVAAAKSGIVLASIAAGLAGLLWLRLLPPVSGQRTDLG